MELFLDLTWDIVKNALGAGFSILVALIIFQYRCLQFRGWTAVLLNGDTLVDVAKLGVETAREWASDEWKRKLGLKSFCADNGCFLRINVLKISEIDHAKRQFIIHFDQNPPAPPKA